MLMRTINIGVIIRRSSAIVGHGRLHTMTRSPSQIRLASRAILVVAMVSSLLAAGTINPSAAGAAASDISSIGFYASPIVWQAQDDTQPPQSPADAVSSLGPVKGVTCGDVMTFWSEIIMTAGANDVLLLEYAFGYDSSSDEGVGLRDVVGVSIHPNSVDGGAAAGVSVVSEVVTPNPDIAGTVREYIPSLEITGLDGGDTIWVQIDIVVGCDPGTGATGTVQSQYTQGWETSGGSNDPLGGGSLTIPGLSPGAPPDWGFTKTPYDSAGNEITSPVGPGETVTWKIAIANLGPVDLATPTLVDDTCSPLVGPSGDANGDTLINTSSAAWPQGTFGGSPTIASETWEWECTQLISSTTTNTASATGDDFPSKGIETSSTVEVEPKAPSIDVVKTAAPAFFEIGETVTWSLEVDNTGNVGFPAIAISDPVCSPFSLVAQDGTLGDLNSDSILNSTETWLYTCSDASLTATTPNTANVTATDGDGDDTTDTAAATATVSGMSVTKSAPASPVVYGTDVTWTIGVQNTGDAPISNVVATDDTCSPLVGPTGDAGTSGVLDIGESWQYSCTSASLTADVTNIASIAAENPDGSPITGTASETVIVLTDADLSVEKSTSSSLVAPGEAFSYTIDVANAGPAPATNVDVLDALPAGISLNGVADATGGGTCTTAVLCEWTNFPVGSQTITIPVIVDDPYAGANPLNNSVTVSSDTPDPNPLNDTSSVDTSISFPSVTLEKTVTSGPTANDDGSFDITYQMMVFNDGAVDVLNLQVEDDLEVAFGATPGPVTVTATPSAANTCSANVDFVGSTAGDHDLLLGSDILPVGESCLIELVANVRLATSPGSGTVYENSAQATGEDSLGETAVVTSTDPTNADGPTPVTVSGVGELGATKQVSSALLQADGSIEVEYAIAVHNTGDVTIDNVVPADDLLGAFGAASQFSSLAVVASSACVGLENPAFDGDPASAAGLTTPFTLTPGQVCQITLSFNVLPGNAVAGDNIGDLFENSVIATGEDPWGGAVSDVSTNDLDPDADGSGTTADDAIPASLQVTPISKLETTKSVTVPAVVRADGSLSVTYEIELANTGNVTVSNIQVIDDIEATFGAGSTLDSITITGSGVCSGAENAAYTGVGVSPNADLLSGGATTGVSLEPSQSCALTVELVVSPTNAPAIAPASTTYTNTAVTTASSPFGTGDVTSSDTADSTVNVAPGATLSKSVVSSSVSSGGVLFVNYELLVRNEGDVNLSDVSIVDDLAATFGVTTAGDFSSGPTLTSTCFTTNTNYDGVADTSVLAGSNVLAAGDDCSVGIALSVPLSAVSPVPDGLGDTTYSNSGTLSAEDPFGNTVAASDGGDITVVQADLTLATSTDKAVAAGYPIRNDDGTLDVAYELSVVNGGSLDVGNLSMVDDLQATFGSGSTITSVTTAASNACVGLENGGFDGDLVAGDAELLVSGVNLPSGQTCNVLVSFTVLPAISPAVSPGSTTYTNQVVSNGQAAGLPSITTSDSAIADFDTSYESQIGVAKTLGSVPMVTADGGFDIDYSFVIQNTGDVDIDDVALIDDLLGTFGAVAEISAVVIDADGPCTGFENSAAFDGDANAGDANLLSASGVVLLVGEQCTVDLSFHVIPGAATLRDNYGTFDNIATAQGIDPYGSTVSDSSVDGAVPDLNGSGDPTDDASPTSFDLAPVPGLSLVKSVVSTSPDPLFGAGGTVTYGFVVENTGNVSLSNVQVDDSIAVVSGGPVDLAPGEVDSSTFTAVYQVSQADIDAGFVDNSAVVTGSDPSGADVLDVSDADDPGAQGSVDSNGDPVVDPVTGEPVDDGDVGNDPTRLMIAPVPGLSLVKSVVSIDPSPSGVFTVRYRLTVENTGNVSLSNVQVSDDLSVAFPAPASASVESALVDSGSCTAATSTVYDGTTSPGILEGADSLPVGESCEIVLVISVDPAGSTGPFANSATAEANDPSGSTTTDVSDAGDEAVETADEAGDTDGDPSNDPTLVSFNEDPEIGVAKAVVGGPINNGDGTYDITFAMTVVNSGDVDLANLQINDDLTSAFPSGVWTVESIEVTSGLCSESLSFDGDVDQGLFVGTDTLASGSSCVVEVSLQVTPGAQSASSNQAEALGTSPMGTVITDQSSDGNDPDSDQDGDPANDSDPTPFAFIENPRLGLAKSIVSGPMETLVSGEFEVTYLLRAVNEGDVVLTDVQIADDLSDAFSGAEFSVQSITTSTGSCAVNADFDGVASINMLAAGATLAVGEECDLELTVRIVPGDSEGPFSNSAAGSGLSPAQSEVTDTSTNGADPDGDGDGVSSNDSVPTDFFVSPPAEPDASMGNKRGESVTVSVIDNDGSPDVPLDPTSVLVLNAETGEWLREVVVDGEGIWTVDPTTGDITFTPEPGFLGDPTPVNYSVGVLNSSQRVRSTLAIGYVVPTVPTLAFTGSEAMGLVLFAIMMMVLGFGLMSLGRRREKELHHG